MKTGSCMFYDHTNRLFFPKKNVPVDADMNPSFHMWASALPRSLHIVHMFTMKVVHEKDREQTPELNTHAHKQWSVSVTVFCDDCGLWRKEPASCLHRRPCPPPSIQAAPLKCIKQSYTFEWCACCTQSLLLLATFMWDSCLEFCPLSTPPPRPLLH